MQLLQRNIYVQKMQQNYAVIQCAKNAYRLSVFSNMFKFR